MPKAAGLQVPASPPTPPVRRIIFTPNATANALTAANAELAARRPGEALKIYTEILTTRSPGHPCVFLNRALCYLQLEYPSLAAVDARRAILAAHFARSGEPGNLHEKQLVNFWQATQEARGRRDAWARPPTWSATGGQGGWLDLPLARLCVEPTRRGRRMRPEEIRLSHDVTLKGYYILTLALWRCGSGALRSALEVLCEARNHDICDAEDEIQFRTVENAILGEIERLMDAENRFKKDIMAAAASDLDKQSYQKMFEEEGIRCLLRMRYSSIEREIYPWDVYSINPSTPDGVDEVNKIIATIMPDCQAQLNKENEKAPELVIIATKDIPFGSSISSESSALHVTSSSIYGSQLLCHTCGALMDVSDELLERLMARPPPPSSTKASAADVEMASPPSSDHLADLDVSEYIKSPVKERKGNGDLEGTHDDMLDGGEPKSSAPPVSQESKTPGPTPPPHMEPVKRVWTEPQLGPGGFQLCTTCLGTAFCSLRCHEDALAFHSATCRRGLEGYLTAAILPHRLQEMPEPNRQRLVGLAMLRLLAFSYTEGTHPLETDWMRLLDGRLTAAARMPQDEKIFESAKRAERQREIPVPPTPSTMNGRCPWSYEANVTRPLHCLFTMGGTSLALDVERFDGWVLNTLMARIDAGLRVTRRPREQKVFDERGEVVSHMKVLGNDHDSPRPGANGNGEKGGYPPEAANSPDYDSEGEEDNEKNKEMWIGIVDPITALLPVAATDADANVEIQEEGARRTCVALSCPSKASNSKSPVETHERICIRAGERIVRKAEGSIRTNVSSKGNNGNRDSNGHGNDDCVRGGDISTSWKNDGFRARKDHLREGDTMIDALETEWGEESETVDVEMEDV